MTVGIVGLGLIGGSFAKAYHAAGWTVYAADTDEAILSFAMLSETVDGRLDAASLKQCDLILIAVYPDAAEAYLRENAAIFDPHTVVIDCLGTKRRICKCGFELAEKHGFFYAGGHPMAGTHNSGYRYARENLFRNAPMVIVPPEFDDMQIFDRIKALLAPAGFGSITVATAEEHDRMIGFTSQMPHILSNAFIKSPTARGHRGFSAGSYKDMTRVAWLNPEMWAELFLDNRDNLIEELDFYITELQKYRTAIYENDGKTLRDLLQEGRERKKEVDGR
ncbi:MAG: prephenate dehydrogenase [Oscillospiraceae bacterium]|nr:prephenate dehydrogenase [Oscillospiraceae bacterium]MBR2366036.1 prephenate dehydrogenase [Oscillospiraceae bacterium]